MRACEIAEVEPKFETRSDDPAAFIVSANLNRRNMTTGQRAMAYAMIYPEPSKGRRGKRSVFSESLGTSEMRGAVSKT